MEHHYSGRGPGQERARSAVRRGAVQEGALPPQRAAVLCATAPPGGGRAPSRLELSFPLRARSGLCAALAVCLTWGASPCGEKALLTVQREKLVV